jgi:hypothetical protein
MRQGFLKGHLKFLSDWLDLNSVINRFLSKMPCFGHQVCGDKYCCLPGGLISGGITKEFSEYRNAGKAGSSAFL